MRMCVQVGLQGHPHQGNALAARPPTAPTPKPAILPSILLGHTCSFQEHPSCRKTLQPLPARPALPLASCLPCLCSTSLPPQELHRPLLVAAGLLPSMAAHGEQPNPWHSPAAAHDIAEPSTTAALTCGDNTPGHSVHTRTQTRPTIHASLNTACQQHGEPMPATPCSFVPQNRTALGPTRFSRGVAPP